MDNALRLTGKQTLADGSVQISNTGSELIYSNAGSGSTSVQMNTMSTPRGGKYKVRLPDGTEVMLNATSSITYPAIFSGNERRVTITGEAYFEVAKNAQRPFIVNVDGRMQIRVLGTHFNVNSYKNEEGIQTTLVEGKVQVTGGNKSVLLNPGEQSDLKEGQLKKSAITDIEKVIAWKNNRFVFDGDKLTSIMRQLERWYDVDIIIEGNQPDELFSGILSRNKNVSEVFKMLQTAADIQYRIEGKKIFVKP